MSEDKPPDSRQMPVRQATVRSAVGGPPEAVAGRSGERRRSTPVLLLSVGLLGVALLIGAVPVADMLYQDELRERGAEPSGGAEETLLVGQPTVERNPRESVPLVALVDFETRRPATASIEVNDGQRRWTYRPSANPATEHHLVVLGLKPDRRHEFRVRVESQDRQSSEVSEPVVLVTPPLPDDFPPLRTVVSQPDKMEPGVTIFAANLWRENTRIRDYGYIIAVDAAGDVVWYNRTDQRVVDLRLLSNGHLLYNESRNHGLFEVDLLGNPVRQWWAAGLEEPPDDRFIPVEADTIHHEILELPSGNFLALSTELRPLVAFPVSEDAPYGVMAEAAVVGDVVIEFRRDGTIVDRLPLLDLLDPHRIGYGSLSPFWSSHYQGLGPEDPCRDWSHANALCYDADSDAVIVSVRNQDCLVKVDRASGQIIWILGDPAGWRPPWREHLLRPHGPLEWPYHQHAPELTPSGTILMYDNGNHRAIPPEPKRMAVENYSRAVEFDVDEDAMSVKQVWEYSGSEGETFYSPFYGETDWMPQTGNVLITDGGRVETSDGEPADAVPSDHQWARIVEITHDSPAEKLFEVVLDSGLGSDTGWSIYRSERLPELSALSDLATGEINNSP